MKDTEGVVELSLRAGDWFSYTSTRSTVPWTTWTQSSVRRSMSTGSTERNGSRVTPTSSVSEYIRVGIYLLKVVNGSAHASHNLCIIDLHPIKDESTGVEGLYAIDCIGV